MPNAIKKRIAIIGLGSIAQKAYLPIMTNHAKVIPVFCTRNEKTLNTLANQYRVNKCYTDIDALIKSKPDAAMVHTATESHFNIVKSLLTAGIPTFVDKPLCYTLQETETLLNLATKTKTSLFVGFNRRYAPLIDQLKNNRPPIQISWQKNRVNLPADPRVFVLDDFIHVIDGLRFLAEGKVENLQAFPWIDKGLLQSVTVQWQQGNTLLSATMNRVNGITEERLEYFTKDHKWVIEELDSGYHFYNEIITPLKFDNWTPTLYKRGFEQMIEAWLDSLEEKAVNLQRIEDILETHRLCETILSKIKID